MGFIDKYPYTDFHELNLDWILKTIRELGIKMDEFEAVNKITFSGAWDITQQYPAWTVVSDNNIGYISIQPVPAGIVLTNTDYWRVIVDYSAQIAGMQTDIINLQNTVGDASSGLVKQTNDNTTAIAALQKKHEYGKWLFLCDSYQSYGQWYADTIALLGLTNNTDAFLAGADGHGFTPTGGWWVDDIINFWTGRTDKEDFKHIVFVGGLNDSTPTAVASDCSYLIDRVENCIGAASWRFPNAEFHMAFVGNACENAPLLAGRTAFNRFTAIQCLRTLFSKKGRHFIENSQYCLYKPALLQSDLLHPTTDGGKIIATAVAEGLLSYTCDINGYFDFALVANFDSGEWCAYQGIRNECANSKVRTTLRRTVCVNTSAGYTIDETGVNLGSIPSWCYVRNSQPIPCRIQKSNSGSFVGMTGRAQLIHGNLWVYSDTLITGPNYQAMAIAAGDRVDLGDLTFEEMLPFSM